MRPVGARCCGWRLVTCDLQAARRGDSPGPRAVGGPAPSASIGAAFLLIHQRPDVRQPSSIPRSSPVHAPRCFGPPSGSAMLRMACRGDQQGSEREFVGAGKRRCQIIRGTAGQGRSRRSILDADPGSDKAADTPAPHGRSASRDLMDQKSKERRWQQTMRWMKDQGIWKSGGKGHSGRAHG
jgi:hypothetical protein